MTITNYGVVNANISRGAQPVGEQFQELKDAGVTTVIDLREDIDRQAEAVACANVGMRHINIPIGDQAIPGVGLLGVLPPTHAQIVLIMSLLATTGKFYIHCAHGEDRTGAVVAAYRMIHDGWTNAQAFQEALTFHINPIQLVIREWIKTFVAKQYQERF